MTPSIKQKIERISYDGEEMDWQALQALSGGRPDRYDTAEGLRALEVVLGEAFILEATRGVIELHPQWLLMEGILRILQSETAVHEAYRIYRSSADAWIKARCLGLMREIPNSVSLDHYPEFLEDPDVAVQAVQLLEKQLWRSPALQTDPEMVALVELAERHSTAAVRQEAVVARSRLYLPDPPP